MAYLSADLRRRIIQALKTESSSLVVAKRFEVSGSAVRKLRMKYAATGEFVAGTAPGRERLVRGKREQQLLDLVARYPDATLNVLREMFEDKSGVLLSETTMWRQLRRMGLTLKKRASAPKSAHGRT